jgi:hypothetical protein
MTDTNERTGEHAAAAWYREDLERIEHELLAVVRACWVTSGEQLVAHALIETAGSVLDAIIRERPAARADVLGRIDQLRLHLAVADDGGQRPQ